MLFIKPQYDQATGYVLMSRVAITQQLIKHKIRSPVELAPQPERQEMKRQNQEAFSLIELLISLGILVIALSIAAPKLSDLIENQRHSAHVNQMIRALSFARTMAITNKTMVSICAGKIYCVEGSQWQSHFIIFIDRNRNGRLEDTDELLREETLHKSYSWKWANFRKQQHMSFKTNGTTHSLNGTFTLCKNTRPIKRVILNAAGRVRLAAPKNVNDCTP